jgi:hypothetical protein
VLTLIMTVISIAVLAGFVWTSWTAISATWTQSATPHFTDAFTYVATALAGLIGGLLAAGLGQKLDRSLIADPAGAAGHTGWLADAARRGLRAVGAFVAVHENWQKLVASASAIAYVVVGIAAIVTWVARPDTSPELVKNLSSLAFGLAIPTARAFMTGAKS